ncbi:unnamed protein product [Cylindrotheca closterium]|uniref:Uncharacterized protein n=1 Tax=Cylindrotheca closterium TaxID=2856 RepID=A0AAD2FSW0_9STRA|nr:unnamed protein product [Cylindrotheca closterium]
MVRIGQRELQALNTDTNITQLPATSTTQPSGTRVTMSTAAGNSTTNRNPSRVLQPGHLETSLVYILETVFGYSAGSILHLALDLYGCKCYLDLVGMDDADIDGLQYPVSQPQDANGDPQPDVLWDVPKPLKAYLHGIRGYVYHRETVLKDPVTLTNCILIDPDDFDTYRASSAFIIFRSCTIPQPLVSKLSRRSPAEEFDLGIKLDANLYPTLSNDKQWDTNTKLQWLTIAQLTTDQWPGSHMSFILHWLDTLRQYHEVAKHPTPKEQLIIMLSNAVRLVPYLRNVLDTSKQLALQNNNRPLTFDEYASLLEAAAQNHDEVTKGSKPKADPRKAYATDVVTTGDLEPDLGPPMFEFNIDMDLGVYYAYCTSLSSACKTFLPNKLWQQLDDQGRRAWHQLPEAANAVILGGSNKPLPAPPSPPPPHRSVNLHYMLAADFLSPFQHLSMGGDVGTLTSEMNEEPTHDKLLAHVTKQSSLQPGELQRVMSDNTRKDVALFDRGANGGIAGDDVRFIVKTNRSVDVQGIDNHKVTNVTIATCAGLTMNQHGPVIVIMNQSAHIGKGLEKENFQYPRLVEPFVTDLASVDLEPDPIVDPETKTQHGTLDDNHVQYPCLVEPVATDLASGDLEPNPLAYLACLASLATLPCKTSLCTAKLEAAGSNNQPPAQPPPSPQHSVNLHEMSTTTDFLSQFQHLSMGRSEDADTLTSATSEEIKSDKLALVPATKYRKATQEVKNHKIAKDGVDVDEWAKSVPDNGSAGEQSPFYRVDILDDGSTGERSPFDRVDILTNSNTTVTTLKDSPAFNDAIGFIETHHCVMATNGLYKLHPGQASDLDWLECNMAGLFDLDPAHVPHFRPPDFEAYKSGRQPFVLFVPETPINFVIESTPKRDKLIDLTCKLSSFEPQCSPPDEGHVQGDKIVELNYRDIQPAYIELCLNIDKGEYACVMAYQNIHKWSQIDKDSPIVWKLKRVVCHHHYIQLKHPSYLGLTDSMAIGWKHGENTPKPLSITGADNSVTYTMHPRNHNLLESQGCTLLCQGQEETSLSFQSSQAEIATHYFTKVYVLLQDPERPQWCPST